MSTTRRFSIFDLLRFNNVNLDPLTETYNMSFYTHYLAKWPEYCFSVTAPQGRPMGYVLGKAEDFHSEPNSWHGHVTAVTVPPEYRRLGIAAQLMVMLERVSEWDGAFFVDLFVRESNALAIGMCAAPPPCPLPLAAAAANPRLTDASRRLRYKALGYKTYRQVIGYYSGEEDALDMRKACSRDPEKKSMIPLPEPVYPDELD